MIINQKFKALIPPLAPEELAQLEANIIKDGCRDPLVVWNGTLIDGHNRYEICQRNGIKFNTVNSEFESETHARIWMRNNQRGRRNLTDAWKIELELGNKDDLSAIGLFKRKETEGRPSKEKLLSNNDNSFKPEPKHNTQAELAKSAGVSTGKLAQAEVVKKKSPELWEKAKSGEITVHAAYKSATVHVGHNSGENEWYSPVRFIDAALETMGSIDCDPASSNIANQTVKAGKFFTKDDDGLKQKWFGNVWMNPPYAQPLMGQFAEAVTSKFESGEIRQACVLVNNATETEWFSRMASKASAICFPSSRVKFLDQNGKPGAPLQGQAVLYFGKNHKQFSKAHNLIGFVCYVVR
jgi:ParB family chromosome partitioning protein